MIIHAMGDSLTYGMSPDRNVKTIDNPWFNQVLEYFSASGINYGINGSTVCRCSIETNPMIERIPKMETPATIVLFMGGVNDFKQGIPLGYLDINDSNSYISGLQDSLRLLKKRFPLSILFLMTSLNHTRLHPRGEDFREWVKIQKYIAHVEGINIIDLHQEFKIDVSREKDIHDFIPDGLHLNQQGADIVANIVINHIEEFIWKK